MNNQRLPGACNRSPGSKLLSITTQLHCGGHLGGRALSGFMNTGPAVKFPSSLVKRLRRIDVETRLKGYKYFENERDFF
jgi:hypothetical protein